MTNEEAIYILRNTGWLAPSLEPIDEAIEIACEALCKDKRGKWMRPKEDSEDAISIAGWCSLCGYYFHLYEDDVVGMNFCPNCGADMRGE